MSFLVAMLVELRTESLGMHALLNNLQVLLVRKPNLFSTVFGMVQFQFFRNVTVLE